MYREGDRMAEVGGMVRTYAAANMVRLADNYPGRDFSSAEIAAMLPKADGTLNGASSVSGWRAMARLIFGKGFDVTSPELRLLARGAKDEVHVKSEIEKDGSTAESITRVLRTYVTDKGVKLQPSQIAELESAKESGKSDAEVEAMRQAMPQLRKPRPGSADTAAAEKSEVAPEEKSAGAPILPRNNTTTTDAIAQTVERLAALVENLSDRVESGNRDRLADAQAQLDGLSARVAELSDAIATKIAASFAAEAAAK